MKYRFAACDLYKKGGPPAGGYSENSLGETDGRDHHMNMMFKVYLSVDVMSVLLTSIVMLVVGGANSVQDSRVVRGPLKGPQVLGSRGASGGASLFSPGLQPGNGLQSRPCHGPIGAETSVATWALRWGDGRSKGSPRLIWSWGET